MISKFHLTLFIIFHLTLLLGQEKIWFKQTKVSEAMEFEKKLNPRAIFFFQNVSLSTESYPLHDKYRTVNPIIVKREPLQYLPLFAEYFFTPKDSVLRLIDYNWEIGCFDNFFDRQKRWAGESKKN